jgi:molybdopterin molybdotransferase
MAGLALLLCLHHTRSMHHDFFTIIAREAFEELLRTFPPLPTERVGLDRAEGRILAEQLRAGHDWPLSHRSCMDGYALDARDAFGASEQNPVYLDCVGAPHVDENPGMTLAPGQCVRIATGGSLPKGADAVVMVEHTVCMDDWDEDAATGTIEVRKAAAPGLNVMQRGEDALAGAVVLEPGTRIGFREVGLGAALGFTEMDVFCRPRVGILSTGDELVAVEHTPRVGQVRDVNSHTLALSARRAGAVVRGYGIVPDDAPSLIATVQQAVAENDLVLLSGGSSIGVRDLTVQAIEAQNDAEILAHGVAISPGKPTILGRAGQTPVMGLPGQVASAQVVMFCLVMPFIGHLQGQGNAFDTTVRPVRQAILARNVASKQGREDYVRIRFEERPHQLPLAHPVLGKSGLLRTLVDAHGLMSVPADAEGVYKDALIDVWTV